MKKKSGKTVGADSTVVKLAREFQAWKSKDSSTSRINMNGL